jgi:hypothetical protein
VGVLVVALARPTPASLVLGLPLAVLGEAVRIWASGHIEKTRRLATGGPYAHSRNPLYMGSLLMALGVAVACASPWVVLAVAAYFLAFYPSVMREERGFLARTFPGEHGRGRPPFLFRPHRPGGPASRSRACTTAGRTAAALPLALLLALPTSGGRSTCDRRAQ